MESTGKNKNQQTGHINVRQQTNINTDQYTQTLNYSNNAKFHFIDNIINFNINKQQILTKNRNIRNYPTPKKKYSFNHLRNSRVGLREISSPNKLVFFMALGKYQVPYSDCKFCRSVCPGFASLGTS